VDGADPEVALWGGHNDLNLIRGGRVQPVEVGEQRSDMFPFRLIKEQTQRRLALGHPAVTTPTESRDVSCNGNSNAVTGTQGSM